MRAYFDCFSGISGDMTLGALVDLGVPIPWLNERIAALPLEGVEYQAGRVSRQGISACQVKVHEDATLTSRKWSDIRDVLVCSRLDETAKEISLKIFSRLAAVEAAVHQIPIEDVHFHEIGGNDAIADIVGTALGLEYLNVERIDASEIPIGSGFVDCRHGRLPVPAPATLALLREATIHGTGIQAELVTPTGAAIVTTLAESYGPFPSGRVQAVGYGAGVRNPADRPNLLRVVLFERPEAMPTFQFDLKSEKVVVIEATIDDMNPEVYGFLMERLFQDGALDVSWTPVFMKKNRPGTRMKVLGLEDHMPKLVRRILNETTTLGVRYQVVRRVVLPREPIRLQTSLGVVMAKRITDPEGRTRLAPEYEDCRRIAIEHNLPIRQVYDMVTIEAAQPSKTGG